MNGPPQNHPISDFPKTPEEQTLEELLPDSKYIREWRSTTKWKNKEKGKIEIYLDILFPKNFEDSHELQNILFDHKIPIDRITDAWGDNVVYHSTSTNLTYKIRLRTEQTDESRPSPRSRVILTAHTNYPVLNVHIPKLCDLLNAIHDYVALYEKERGY